MKTVTKLLFVCGMSVSLSASETLFFGFEASNSAYKAKDETNSYKTDSDIDYGLRVGAKAGSIRGILALNKYSGDHNDATYVTYQVDKLFSDSNVQPFVGAHVGYGRYKSDHFSTTSRWMAGVQTGIVMDFVEQVDIEVFYRHSFVDSNNIDGHGNTGIALNFPF